jgi:hypothetical protein
MHLRLYIHRQNQLYNICSLLNFLHVDVNQFFNQAYSLRWLNLAPPISAKFRHQMGAITQRALKSPYSHLQIKSAHYILYALGLSYVCERQLGAGAHSCDIINFPYCSH